MNILKAKLLTKEPALEYKSSRFINSEGQTISACLVYDRVQVEVLFENPMRKQTVTSLIKVAIYRDIPRGPDVKVKEESRIVTLPPLSSGKITVSFIPMQESRYFYGVLIEEKRVYAQPKSFPPRLYVSRSETNLILDEAPSKILAGSTVTFTGKLLRDDPMMCITKAKICVCKSEVGRNRLLASGITENDGTFVVEWIARKMNPLRNDLEICAKFEGDDVYKPSTSNHYTINVAQIFQNLPQNPIELAIPHNFGTMVQSHSASNQDKP